MMKLLTIAGHDPVHGAGLTADLAMHQSLSLWCRDKGMLLHVHRAMHA